MSLSYVKEDLARYLDQRNLTRIPFNFQLIMFPHKGKQPCSFDGDSNRSNKIKSKRKIDDSLSLGYDSETEVRWWFHPLIFADEIPFEKTIIGTLVKHPLSINPMCSRNPNHKEIYQNNRTAVTDLANIWGFSEKTFENPEGKIGWSDVSSSERYRVMSDAKMIARMLKSDYPEIFGESGDAESTSGKFLTLDGEPLEEEKRGASKVMAKIKSISPKLGKKFSRTSSDEKMKESKK